MITEEETMRRFSVLPKTDDQQNRIKQMRESAQEYALGIMANTSNGREQALALTRLQEVVFWISMAIEMENQ